MSSFPLKLQNDVPHLSNFGRRGIEEQQIKILHSDFVLKISHQTTFPMAK